MKKLMLLLPGFLLSLGLSAQQPDSVLLLPDEAVRIALANNYDIELARTDADIARLNNTRGNAGMLPTVNLVAGDNATLNGVQVQNLADGRHIEAYGVFSNTVNAAVQLEWTLFDGGRMYITKKRLTELEALGQIDLRATVQQTSASVLLTYYDIVRSRQQERALAEVIALNEERLRIAEARLAAGMAAQTDALQARIDLNQRRADLLAQQNATATAKRELNRLLARDPNDPVAHRILAELAIAARKHRVARREQVGDRRLDGAAPGRVHRKHGLPGPEERTQEFHHLGKLAVACRRRGRKALGRQSTSGFSDHRIGSGAFYRDR